MFVLIEVKCPNPNSYVLISVSSRFEIQSKMSDNCPDNESVATADDRASSMMEASESLASPEEISSCVRGIKRRCEEPEFKVGADVPSSVEDLVRVQSHKRICVESERALRSTLAQEAVVDAVVVATEELHNLGDVNGNIAPDQIDQTSSHSRIPKVVVSDGGGICSMDAVDGVGNNVKVEANVVHWSEEQLELLTSAIPSYKFLPKTTIAKMYHEMNSRMKREDPNVDHHIVQKRTIHRWLEAATHFYDHGERYEHNLDTMEQSNASRELDDPELAKPKLNRKLSFSEAVQCKNFDIESPASVVVSKEAGEASELKLTDGEDQFDWSEDQLEVLNTTVAAYKYYPKLVVKKVFKELRKMPLVGNTACSKLQISNWLKEVTASEDITPAQWKVQEKLDIIRSKAREDVEEHESTKDASRVKVQFSETIGIKLFERNSPANDG